VNVRNSKANLFKYIKVQLKQLQDCVEKN